MALVCVCVCLRVAKMDINSGTDKVGIWRSLKPLSDCHFWRHAAT